MSPVKKTARKASKKPARKPSAQAARPRPAAKKAPKAPERKKPAAAEPKKAAAAEPKRAVVAEPKNVPASSKKTAPAAPAKKPAAAPAPPGAATPVPPRPSKKPAEVRKPAARPRGRPPIVPDIVKPGLGGRWECFRCGSKFYDLGRPEPVCPKCGADQREKPREKPSPPSPPPEKPRRAAVPMGSLLDEDEEPVEEFEAEEGDLTGLDADAFLSETPDEEEEDVDVSTLDEE